VQEVRWDKWGTVRAGDYFYGKQNENDQWGTGIFAHRIIWGVFKKRPNFLNSVTTSTENVLLLLSTHSVRFWQQIAICPVSLWALVV
jgi:hypothetical protein